MAKKKLLISGAIRYGIKFYPEQCFGNFTTADTKGCCAAHAFSVAYNDKLVDDRIVKEYFTVKMTANHYVPTLNEMVISMNDDARMTREQIADFFEELGL